ncbi:MAG: TolC family outer membrane protein [Rhodobacteraceae bacterium]|nr:TolC family outer membrane protein [Paracoccaceae bacterium]
MKIFRHGPGLRAVLFTAALAVAAPAIARADTLADALVGAYNTSGLLTQNRALLRAADEDVAGAVATLRPVVTWTASVGRTYNEGVNNNISFNATATSAALSLNATLLLFDGGGRTLAVQGAKETVLATRQALISIEQSVLQRAVQAYMNVVRETEFVALRESNVRLITQELRAAQDRFDVGEVTRTDVALAESRLAEARSNLATAQGNLVNAQEEYLNAVGKRPGRLSPPPGLPRRPASIDAAKSVAVRNHPDILQAQHQIAASELAVLRAETALKPQINLSGALGLSEELDTNDNSDTASLTLQLSQTLYQGGGISSAIRAAMAARDAQRANLLNVQENVTQNVSVAFVQLDVAGANIEATDRRIRAARVAFDGIREEATLGARTTLDVLDAEQELLDAQAARISAQRDLYVAAYALLSAQGLLTADRLRLGVQIYDPAAYYNQVQNAPALRSKQGAELDRVLRALSKD